MHDSNKTNLDFSEVLLNIPFSQFFCQILGSTSEGVTLTSVAALVVLTLFSRITIFMFLLRWIILIRTYADTQSEINWCAS